MNPEEISHLLQRLTNMEEKTERLPVLESKIDNANMSISKLTEGICKRVEIHGEDLAVLKDNSAKKSDLERLSSKVDIVWKVFSAIIILIATPIIYQLMKSIMK